MIDKIYLDVAFRIRRERRTRGITLEETAHRASLATSYLGQIERGERKPSLHAVAAIAEALGVPLSALLDRAEPRPAPDSPGRRLEALLRGASPESRAAALETVGFVLRLLRRRGARGGARARG